MKKIFLGMTLFFLLTFNVNAETILADDLEKGDVYSKEDVLDILRYDHYPTVLEHLINVVYLNKDGDILEAFTASNGAEYTYSTIDNVPEYPRDMFLWYGLEFNFGTTCKEIYRDFSEEHEKWCENHLSMYSSKFDISSINYWEVENVDEMRLSDFCTNNPQIQETYPCNGEIGELYDSYPLIILKEYAPAEFKLECSPKEVKKGETSNCQLRIKSSDSINKITINTNLNNELFSINDIKGIEGWEIIENKDGIITLTTENEFQTEGVILSTTIQFKEDVVDTVDIELNNIDYTTTTGYELKSSTKENIKVYEEIKNPETTNPFTGILCLLGIIILTNVFMYYKSRKAQGSEII